MRKSLTFAASLMILGGLNGCDDSEQAKPSAMAKPAPATPTKTAEVPAPTEKTAPRKLHHFRAAWHWQSERPTGFPRGAFIPASYTSPPGPYDDNGPGDPDDMGPPGGPSDMGAGDMSPGPDEMGPDDMGPGDSGDYSSDALTDMSVRPGPDSDADEPPPPSDEAMGDGGQGYAPVPPPPPPQYSDSEEDPTVGLTDDARTRADLLAQRHAVRHRPHRMADVWVDGYGVAHPQAGGESDPPTLSDGETETRLDPWHAYDEDCPQLGS